MFLIKYSPKLTDILSSKGGAQINGLMEALKQTPEGKGIMSLLSNIAPGLTDSDSNKE